MTARTRHRHRRRRLARACQVLAPVPLALLLTATLAQAQQQATQQQSTSGTVSSVLSFLLTNQAVPTGDPARDAQAASVSRDTIARFLQVELAAQPVNSSSPGLIYRLSPELGTMTRASGSFGPFFTERSLTVGKHQASFGMSSRFEEFTSLDGHDLHDGNFVTSANQFRDETQPFDVETLTLDLTSRTFDLFATVGLTDRLDVGVALPLESISMSGTRQETYRGQVLLQATARASATGLGDIAVRGKYDLIGEGAAEGGLAGVVEVRLPTGNEANLLGAGKTSVRMLLIGSYEPGRVSAHVNAGYVAGGLARELQYRGSVDVTMSPRVAVVGELVGRRLSDVGRITTTRTPNPMFEGVDTIRLESDGSSSHTASAVGGLKWNIGGTWLLGGSVSVPLTNRGLKSRPVVQIGLDYAFAQ
jgi:hypothetical protein